ncbi:uncharacterized protein LOC110708622 isoform X2 [Chenopodium quinoa]|uniref:uncharacterized protein LOC110708622 isoform X2 n=1 Tax=Chenopodium quinoa TaxID=63459 RepID=UPI000B78F915|nr:uncharacterized protein LOC110708622 isoform X2 [Chenopodium quinoa]
MPLNQFSSREIMINALIGGGLTAFYGGFPVVERRFVGGAEQELELELELERHGMKLDPASVSFTPNLDEGFVVLWEFDCTEISKLCFRNAAAYLRYKSQLESLHKLLDPIWDTPTFGISEAASSFDSKMKNKLNELTHWSACLQHAVSLGQKEMGDVMELFRNYYFAGMISKPTEDTNAYGSYDVKQLIFELFLSQHIYRKQVKQHTT